jgi:predicted Zn-dependent protease
MKLKYLAWGLLAWVCIDAGTVLARTESRKSRQAKIALEERRQEMDDLLNLVSVLIQDGHFDRARAVLTDFTAEDVKLVAARYYLLSGLIYLSVGDMRASEVDLRRSVDAGQTDPMVHVFLAQVCFKLEKYPETVEHVKLSGAAGDALVGVHLMKASAQRNMKDFKGALDTFSRAAARFVDSADLWHSHVLLLVELGLFQQAGDEARQYLKRENVTAVDYTVVSEALLRAEAYEEAIHLLEIARLKWPDNRDLTIQLARSYLNSGHELISARLFHAASLEDESFVQDAAELYRRHGKLSMALRLNERILDQKAKIRQRLGLLIEMERFEEASALSSRLSRLGLLEDDTIRYALAYALFKVGQMRQAEEQLARIQDAAVFQKSMELRMSMEQCRQAGWQCQ